MTHMPLAAGLLAIAVSLAGCGDSKEDKRSAAQVPSASSSTATGKKSVDEVAAQAVVAHSADLVQAA